MRKILDLIFFWAAIGFLAAFIFSHVPAMAQERNLTVIHTDRGILILTDELDSCPAGHATARHVVDGNVTEGCWTLSNGTILVKIEENSICVPMSFAKQTPEKQS